MIQKCVIWRTPAEVRRVDNRDAFRVRSLRAGGNYKIDWIEAVTIRGGALDEPAKAKLTTALINRRRDGDDVPIVDSNLVEESKHASALTHGERAKRLLSHIADRELASPGQPVSLATEDPGALAHSESWTADQLQILVKHLEQEHLLEIGMRTQDSTPCTVTVTGHNQLDAHWAGR